MDKLSYEDVDVSDKRVLIRVDFNVPLKDGVITNTQRIDGAVPTIRAVLERGAKVRVAKEAAPRGAYSRTHGEAYPGGTSSPPEHTRARLDTLPMHAHALWL